MLSDQINNLGSLLKVHSILGDHFDELLGSPLIYELVLNDAGNKA
jgi:hypothetical protein